MSETIPSDHPNLKKAAGRLRRIVRIWALCFGAYGVFSLTWLPPSEGMAAVPWLAAGVWLALSEQPALLALAASLWGISMTVFIPGVDALLGADALATALGAGSVELVALILARVLLGITAWNQFLFYRMLYGTSRAAGLEPSQQPIPEVIPNRTNRIASLARLLGSLALIAALVGVPLYPTGLARFSFQLGYGLMIFGFGLGLGAAFSPTDRRSAALAGVGLSIVAFMMVLTAGRLL
jgi:hypothetical protein